MLHSFFFPLITLTCYSICTKTTGWNFSKPAWLDIPKDIYLGFDLYFWNFLRNIVQFTHKHSSHVLVGSKQNIYMLK